ncbi:DedA family protein [Candidatus Parcubacteria bacterium]|nr:DedA family protein [Patescibacteria group bacterium]MBU4309106.1 DedA family protein [Patescibacteria group bacterium]MBU4431952.1 DedA family protein [Patescibacteria group bacterium]MBU4577467.1 DedA family protein [Patescibacteria group bacterium]MCG2697155.1 DedA family protein [Candidatus Parcubacteria bacterium]
MLTLAQIYLSLIKFQYIILFPVVVIEGPIISVIGGFLIAQGLMNFYLTYAIIIIGDLAGDCLYYSLGRWGRDFGLRLLRLTPRRLEKLEHHFDNHGGKTILLSKLAHGIGTTFLFAAGAAKMPFGKYLYYNGLGTIPKSLILIIIGYLFGKSFVRIGTYFDYYALFTIFLGIVLLTVYVMLAKKIQKKEDI